MFKLCVWNEKEAWLSQFHKDKHTHLSGDLFCKQKIQENKLCILLYEDSLH
jgi:hypothetical protein